MRLNPLWMNITVLSLRSSLPYQNQYLHPKRNVVAFGKRIHYSTSFCGIDSITSCTRPSAFRLSKSKRRILSSKLDSISKSKFHDGNETDNTIKRGDEKISLELFNNKKYSFFSASSTVVPKKFYNTSTRLYFSNRRNEFVNDKNKVEKEEEEKGEDQIGNNQNIKANEKDKDVSRESFLKPLKEWGLKEFTIFASFLCAIDCTIFPILLTLLPAAEFLSPANVKSIHEISHQVALYVVLPLGSTTTITNYILNKNKLWTAVSLGALSLIFASNIPHQGIVYDFLVESGDEILNFLDLSPTMKEIFHEMHTSRIYNTSGCIMLMASSYFSHKGSHNEGKCCSHHHDQNDHRH